MIPFFGIKELKRPDGVDRSLKHSLGSLVARFDIGRKGENREAINEAGN